MEHVNFSELEVGSWTLELANGDVSANVKVIRQHIVFFISAAVFITKTVLVLN